MLRLQNRLIYALRAASHAPASTLHLFHLSNAAATATAAPSAQFVVEDYLVASCGLAPAQACRASKYLRHLKSPANPDAVRAFLADAGIAEADIASAIASDPRLLCSKVDKTLAPRVAQLRDMGLSPTQISRLVAMIAGILYNPSKITRLEFYISLLGSYARVETALKRYGWFLLSQDIENVVKPNMAFLQQCGLSQDDTAGLCLRTYHLLTSNLEHVKTMVARAEKLGVRGVRPSSGMFKKALIAVCSLTAENVIARTELLERALGYAEAKIAVSKLPSILTMSEVKLAHRVEFLTTEFSLEPLYIAHRPAILTYSLERRLIPRYFVIHVLKAKGLVKRDIDLFGVFSQSHEKFVHKYLHHQ
ncbi:transcription termination factor MTERF15, mitochondrial [Lolium perenne]|uniref:transcription termination factor MTERF15, mitochondrial n=1 Tax=Lolium perenne TaxID=4522 RepID=UPI0021EA7509|nr:transcription termination factor MTERF15, mitochondrial-like [Lolium perenne]